MAWVNWSNEFDWSDYDRLDNDLPDRDQPEVESAKTDAPSSDLLPASCSDMAEDMVLKFRRVAQGLNSSFTSNNELKPLFEAKPIIIVMKGDPIMARKLIAFCVASIIKCPLIKENDVDKSEEKRWRKICNLAISQVMLGRSIVIDTELSKQNEFDHLKELTEITKRPLAVFECRVDNTDKLWKSLDDYGGKFMERDPVIFLLPEFKEGDPTSQCINSKNLDIGEIPKILVELKMQNLNRDLFETSVYHALMDYQAHIFPSVESKKAKECNHKFEFTNIENEYKRPCCKCKQLISGSVYCCRECRFIVHRTCNYFPESLTTRNTMVDGKQIGPGVTLNLRNVVPELAVDARCNCCNQLLRYSTSSLYYCSNEGPSLFGFRIIDIFVYFDLDCLFLLPAEKVTMFHEHKLRRYLNLGIGKKCKECDVIINHNTICYCCDTCGIYFDVFCLWLPESVKFNRHRHSFELTVVPRVDPYPYYCDVCEKERNTDKWIYYCEDCDFPIHPRCIVKAPCLPRYSSTEISTTNKKSKEKLPVMEFHSCSSHLSTEKAIVTELQWLLKKIEHPIIIMIKGHSTGRKLVARILAAGFDCLLIDGDSLCEVTRTANEPKQVSYHVFSQITLSQLQIGLSVVIDSDLSHESEFFILRDFAKDTKTPFFIVECNLYDEDNLEDFHGIVNLQSDYYQYKAGDTPKIFVNLHAPTFDDIKKHMPHILQSFSAYLEEWKKGHTKVLKTQSCLRHFLGSSCHRHRVNLCDIGQFVTEGEKCDKCSKKLSTPILKCVTCELVLHKTCTEFPEKIMFDDIYTQDTRSHVPFDLKKYGDDNDKVRCAFCHSFIKSNAYTHVTDDGSLICIDLDCLFTPKFPGRNLHEHLLELSFVLGNFVCKACGSICKNTFCYRCPKCPFKISAQCGWLKETQMFGRHRHSFHLSISPKQVSNQYYCEVCQEKRDKDHWIYYCKLCDFPIHIHCCLPTAGCQPLES